MVSYVQLLSCSWFSLSADRSQCGSIKPLREKREQQRHVTRRECKALKMPKQEILTRRQFQADLASSLILVNTTPLKTPKRGRPSSGNGSPAPTVTSRSPLNAQKRPSSGDGSPPNGAPSKRSQPPLDVRKDLMAHFPVKTKRGCCRHRSKGYTNTQCTKCDARLCFSDDRNCFWDYHCIHI
ncbi:hypothetical protein F7725_016630 [Dissostichus mawsoni]|uniref:Uncharacterized protein n=1 Tax=Dissostichus mawsoni TaxID=36200 RepID=A0A7J5Z531_DISMA|nr:hypothetical protein F7725_016630 [Dissostichus mawsoni]